MTQLSLKPPAPFDFERVACFHGWVMLAPNAWDAETRAVRRVERLSTGRVVLLVITGAGSVRRPTLAIEVHHPGRLSGPEKTEVTAAVGRLFRFEEDFSGFYALCKKRGKRWRKLTAGLGRSLRSTTVFEDLVKCICTTNVQWTGTMRMVDRLVNAFGEPYPGGEGLRAFPVAEAIARAGREVFAETVRMGYRSDYVYGLAQSVACGELDLESFRDRRVPTAALKKKLLKIKGIGNYAAATQLMLLGRYDELAVDSAFRTFVSKKYFGGQAPSDREAQALYADWGEWKYLAYWFELWEAFQKRTS